MPLSTLGSYETPKRHLVIKLKCLAVPQCLEHLGKSEPDKRARFYNAIILDCKEISNQNERNKIVKKSANKLICNAVFSVDLQVCKEHQPVGLCKNLFGEVFRGIPMGLWNYGNNSTSDCIWYILNDRVAARAKGRQKEYRQRKKAGLVGEVKRGGDRTSQ
jgi:hypothetical protein